MSVLNAIRNHPVHGAILLAAAFGAWVAWDASRGSVKNDVPPPPADSPDMAHITAPQMFDPANATRDVGRPGVVTADLLTRLVPGMARVAVEELIGQPPAGLVHPVSMVDGRFIYRASYLANLDSMNPAGSPAPRSIIALEFDAGRPGHPLLKVHIPDPMS